MKKLLILIASLGAMVSLSAQNAPDRVVNLLEKREYLTLDRLLPEVGDSLPTTLRLTAGAFTDAALRRFDRSSDAIGMLLNEHTETLDPNMYGALISQLIINFRFSGNNSAAADLVGQLRDQAEDPAQKQGLAETQQFFQTMAGLPQSRLERPVGDVAIPFRLDSAGRGTMIIVDALIGGKTEPFVFDTGCAEMSFVSEAFARSHGIRHTGVELEVGGVAGSVTGWLGTADSLCVGEMVLRDPVFAVAPSLPTDSLIGVSAILGCNFMLAAGQIDIYGKRQLVVFPAEKSPAPDFAPNMVMGSNGLFYVSVPANGETLSLQFDSGNVKSTLSATYFARHKEQIEASLPRKEHRAGGIGGMKVGNAYTLPSLALRFGATEGELSNVDIAADLEFAHETGEDGSLGVDFLLAFDRVQIDYDRMFIAAEQNGQQTLPLKTEAVPAAVDPGLTPLRQKAWNVKNSENKIEGEWAPKTRKNKRK